MLTDDQKRFRLGKITSSEIPAIVGVSPFAGGTPLGAYFRILGEAEVEESESMREGSDLEAAIGAAFARAHPEFAVEPGISIQGPRTYFAATPDFIVSHSRPERDRVGVLECKAVGRGRAGDWSDNGEARIPEHVLVQIYWQMYCTGLRRAWARAFFGPGDFLEIEVERNEEAEGILADIAESFYRRHVEPRVPPEPTDNAEAVEQLRRTYRRTRAAEIVSEDSPEGLMIAELADLSERTDEIEARVEILKLELARGLDGRESIGTERGTFGVQARRTTQWKQLAQRVGYDENLKDECTRISTSFVFRRRKGKDNGGLA